MHQPFRFRRVRNGQDDEVRARQQRVQFIGRIQLVDTCWPVVLARVHTDDAHAEGAAFGRRLRANPAHADNQRGGLRQMDHSSVESVGSPLVSKLARNVALEPTRERQDEGHDVRGDVLVEDAALVGDHHGVVDELVIVEARRGGNGRRLQPLQLPGLAQHVGRQRPERRIGVDDLLTRIPRRFGDDDVERGHLLGERDCPTTGGLALRRQKHKLGHRPSG